MACFLRPDSAACADLNADFDYGYVLMEVRDSGVYRCFVPNPSDGKEVCEVVPSSDCLSSSFIPNCYYNLASLDRLKENPDEIIPSSDGEGLENYAYVAYYTDDACSDFAGVRGAYSLNSYEQLRVGEEEGISCMDKQACFLAPYGQTCMSLLGGVVDEDNFFTVTLETDGVNVYECDPTNEAVGEPICEDIDPQRCNPSSSMFGCNFRMMAAPEFAQDPKKIIHPSEAEW
eukprot:740714_1